MSVVRTQYGVVSASVTIPDTGVATSLDLPRPNDGAESNTIDFVKRPSARKEFESGRAVVTLDATLVAAADIYLSKVEIVALNPGISLAPLNLSFSQFPETPVAGQPVVLRTLLDYSTTPSPFALSATVTADLLKNILVRTSEFIRLTFVNPAGGTGATTGVVSVRYDFGLNAGNYGSLPLLI